MHCTFMNCVYLGTLGVSFFLRARLFLQLLYYSTLLSNAWHYLVCSRPFSSEPPEWTCFLHGTFSDFCLLGHGGGKTFSYAAPSTVQQLLWNAWHYLVCSMSFLSELPEWTCCLHGTLLEVCLLGRGRGDKPFS